MRNDAAALDGGFPEDLPPIGRDETFHFACGPEQPCFNRCCAQLNLPLTPYDVVRICRNAGLASQDFLQTFAQASRDPATGFLSFTLRMIESPDAPCPFSTPAGCSVYEDRPGACRSYPIGRGAKMDKHGVAERFFIVREEHCAGFCNPNAWTPASWLADQGLEPYQKFNDAYMRLLSLVAATGKPIGQRLAGMAQISLWQMDRLKELIEKTGLLGQVEGSLAVDPALLEDGLAGAEARLAFGVAWLELLIFGKADNLARRI